MIGKRRQQYLSDIGYGMKVLNYGCDYDNDKSIAGCGLCQTKVPCEFQNPTKKLNEENRITDRLKRLHEKPIYVPTGLRGLVAVEGALFFDQASSNGTYPCTGKIWSYHPAELINKSS